MSEWTLIVGALGIYVLLIFLGSRADHSLPNDEDMS